MRAGSSHAAAVVASAALIVRQYLLDGFYPGGFPGSGSSWAPSAALVRAMLLTGTVAVDWSYAQDGKYGTSTDESNLLIPNTKGGFGQLQLANILRATEIEKELDDCKCLGGTTFFAPDADKEFGDVLRKDIFSPNYGTSCAPWDVKLSPSGGHICNSSFTLLERVPDISCCKSWCFVAPSCKHAITRVFPHGIKGQGESISLSYDACKDVLEECPFRDRSLKRLLKYFIKDHIISDANSPDKYGTYSRVDILKPADHSLAENESATYNVTILSATPQEPLIITMVYTDPPGDLKQGEVLVNDLDLTAEITPLLAESARNRLDKFYGNQYHGGDPYNTVEQIRITDSGPAVVIIKVLGKRVTVGQKQRYKAPFERRPGDKMSNTSSGEASKTQSSEGGSQNFIPQEPGDVGYKPPPPEENRTACQTFAFVIVGNFMSVDSASFSFERAIFHPHPDTCLDPPCIQLGMCGRPPADDRSKWSCTRNSYIRIGSAEELFLLE
jgi:hypothetical protein